MKNSIIDSDVFVCQITSGKSSNILNLVNKRWKGSKTDGTRQKKHGSRNRYHHFASSLQQDCQESFRIQDWHVIVGQDLVVQIRHLASWGFVFKHKRRGNLQIIIFRAASDLRVPVTTVLAPIEEESLDKKLKGIVSGGNMDRVKEKECLLLVNEAMNHAIDTEKIALIAKNALASRYGNTWQLIVSTSQSLSVCPYAPNENSYLDVLFTNAGAGAAPSARMVMFQHEGNPDEMTKKILRLANKFLIVLSLVCMFSYTYLNNFCPTECAEELLEEMDLKDQCSKESIAEAHGCKNWTFAALGLVIFSMTAGAVIKVIRKVYSRRSQPKKLS